jgi:hypothetical protein
MKIARVFPRRTAATPKDSLAWSLYRTQKGEIIWESALPPRYAMPEIDAVHVSVAFTYDMPEAEILAKEWRCAGVPVLIGGPATGQAGGEFEPGMYLKRGYAITSRGCPNRCWFCSVPKREGVLRELPIKDGFNILDDNLLACSEEHIRSVFAMLERQTERPIFSGGLEAAQLKPWHVDLIRKSGMHHLFMAYDTPDDYEPLVTSGKMLMDAGYTFASHALRAYVLIGYPGDTMDKAEKRLIDTLRAGFWPMAMLWKDDKGNENAEWRRFQGQWVRPAELHAKVRDGEIVL